MPKLANVAAVLAVAVLTSLVAAAPPSPYVFSLGILAGLAIVCALFLYHAWVGEPFADPLDVDSSMPDGPPDPWQRMRHLMEISDQRLPTTPLMTNHAVMYACLNMEELGETLAAVAAVLQRMESFETSLRRGTGTPPSDFLLRLRTVHGRLHLISHMMQTESSNVRAHLGFMGDFSAHMTEDEAAEILDGTADLTVTNCGFSLACGLDGGAGYAEAQDSNLSKANPDTGRIDKTHDGKWIKGRGYRAPDMRAIVRRSVADGGVFLG